MLWLPAPAESDKHPSLHQHRPVTQGDKRSAGDAVFICNIFTPEQRDLLTRKETAETRGKLHRLVVCHVSSVMCPRVSHSQVMRCKNDLSIFVAAEWNVTSINSLLFSAGTEAPY